MPQLEVSTFAPQLFWLAVIFVALYIVMKSVALPQVGRAIEARRQRREDDLARATRMKAEADHRIPLSDRMLELIGKLDRSTTFVFSGLNPNKKLPHEAMLKVLKAIWPSVTVHGFRSTFKDWASEQTAYSNEVSEMALAHKIHSKVESAYRRGDLFEKRRALMADWTAFCGDVSHG